MFALEIRHTVIINARTLMTSGEVFVAKIFNGGNMGKANVNVNEASKRSYFNVKDRVYSSRSQAKIRRTQRIADELTRKFGDPAKGSYAYLCKCANRLSESTIWSIYEKCHRIGVTNSWAYFLSATKAQPEMN